MGKKSNIVSHDNITDYNEDEFHFILTKEEEESLGEFVKLAGPNVTASKALQFLRANSFNVGESLKKFKFFTRRTKYLAPSFIAAIPLLFDGFTYSIEVTTIKPGLVFPQGVVSIPSGIDRDGSPFIMIAAKYLPNLSWIAPDDVLAASIYIINYVVESVPSILRNGCSLLVDFQNTSWALQKGITNPVLEDQEMSQILEDSEILLETIREVIFFFSNAYPIRWNSIIFYKPWWYIQRAPNHVISVNSEEELWEFISPRNLPIEYGGSLYIDREQLFYNLLSRARASGEMLAYETSTPIRSKEKMTNPAHFISERDSRSIIMGIFPENRVESKLSKQYPNCTLDQIKGFIMSSKK